MGNIEIISLAMISAKSPRLLALKHTSYQNSKEIWMNGQIELIKSLELLVKYWERNIKLSHHPPLHHMPMIMMMTLQDVRNNLMLIAFSIEKYKRKMMKLKILPIIWSIRIRRKHFSKGGNNIQITRNIYVEWMKWQISIKSTEY